MDTAGPVTRRGRADKDRGQTVLRVADLFLDTQARSISRANHVIGLQHREFLMLERLMRHAGEVVMRSMLLDAVWDYDFEPRGNIIDMLMHRLHWKINHGFERQLIRRVPGAGYMLDGEETT